MQELHINEKAIELLQNGEFKKWNELIKTINSENPNTKIIVHRKAISCVRSPDKSLDFRNVEFVECAINHCTLVVDFSKTTFSGCHIANNFFVNSSFNGTVFQDSPDGLRNQFSNNDFNSCMTDGIIANLKTKNLFLDEVFRSSIYGAGPGFVETESKHSSYLPLSATLVPAA